MGFLNKSGETTKIEIYPIKWDVFSNGFCQTSCFLRSGRKYIVKEKHKITPVRSLSSSQPHWWKKRNRIFLIYKETQSGEFAKSYMRKGFLIYEEMRKYFPIHEEALGHILLCNCSIHFWWGKIFFSFFFSAAGPRRCWASPPNPKPLTRTFSVQQNSPCSCFKM